MSSETITYYTCDTCGACEPGSAAGLPCGWDYRSPAAVRHDLCERCAETDPLAEFLGQPCHCCGKSRRNLVSIGVPPVVPRGASEREAPTVEPEVKEIRGCFECPMFVPFGTRGGPGMCSHWGSPQAQAVLGPEAPSVFPEWCPMKKRPLLYRIAEVMSDD